MENDAVSGNALPQLPLQMHRVARRDACDNSERLYCLAELCVALGGPSRVARLLGAGTPRLTDWAAGREVIPLRHFDGLVALARREAEFLAAFAVQLELVDRPVLLERRRIVRQQRRERFRRRFGYYPEENQVARRQRPPSG